MHDALEQTFDRWIARAGGGGGTSGGATLRIGLTSWPGTTVQQPRLDATPLAMLTLQKGQVFADRYVRGVLEDQRLMLSLRFGYAPPQASQQPQAFWRDTSPPRPMTQGELAAVGVLAIRAAYHAGPRPDEAGAAFRAFSAWLLTALDAGAVELDTALRQLEPRVYYWWGLALAHTGDRTLADRAWSLQVSGPEEALPTDAAVQSLLELAEGLHAAPADRLGFCRRAQRLLDQSTFRVFDLQTRLDLARAAALLDLRYTNEAYEALQQVKGRLVANPCAGAARQSVLLGRLSLRAAGPTRTLLLSLRGLAGVTTSATARFKLHRAWELRHLRPRQPRLPQAITVLDQQPSLAPPQRLALLRLDKLGDLVTMQPVISRIRQHFPAAKIDVYVTAGLESLVHRLAPDLRAVGVAWRDPAAYDRQLKTLAQQAPYDLVVDLLEPDAARQLRLLRALPAKQKVTFDSPGRREHATHRIPPPQRPLHLVDRTAWLLRPLGLAVPDEPGWAPVLQISAAERAEGQATLAKLLGPGPTLGVHVGAGWKFKRWYPEAFGRVAASLAQQHAMPVVVLAGASEQQAAATVAAAVGERAQVLTPTLEALPGLLAALRLVLVNDSGPMHLAVALGVPTVVAWGPGDRTLFSPRPTGGTGGAGGTGEAGENCVVVADQPRCANCPQEIDGPRCPMGYRYDQVPCLRQISEAAVLAACEDLWQRAGA